jgi:hypothetical protein
MTKKSNTIAAGLLLLSLTMGMAGSATAETPNETDQKLDKTIRVSAVKSVPATALGGVYMTHSTGFGLLGNPVHERNYLKLMVKAYSPDSEQAWNGAFEERKQVEAQFSKSMTIRLEAALPSVQAPESEAFMITTAKPLDEEIATKDTQVGDKKVQVTFIHKDKAVVTEAQNNPVGAPSQDVIIHGEQPITMEASPQAKLQGEFSKAVDTSDATAIKALLPKLLEDYKQTTDNMLKSIEQQKQIQADASNQAKPSSEDSK